LEEADIGKIAGIVEPPVTVRTGSGCGSRASAGQVDVAELAAGGDGQLGEDLPQV
jgi:hypothetical protein